MLIIPAHKPLNRRNFPLVTLLILLANVVVFFGFQASDWAAQREAVDYYLDSSLPAIEWPRYVEFVKQHDRDAHGQVRELRELAGSEDVDERLVGQIRLNLIESHEGFQQALDAHRIVPPDDPAFERWRRERERFESLMSQSFTESHDLDYVEPAPTTFISHMFLHGGFGHLLGNMIFLVMLGLLVEGALGGPLFLGAYLLGGLGAAAASVAVRWGDPTGLVGASGAIAGLMGLYAVLYNTRPVRFFYWAFVYFDYVKQPAIVLLPLWLGWELLQLVLDSGGRVAYEAHAGGIVTGAVLAAVVLALGWERRDFLDEEVVRDADRASVEQALADLRELNVDRAKRRLRGLLTRHGHDRELLRVWYGACKLKAGDPDLADAAKRIFRLPGRDAGTRALIAGTAADFAQRAEPGRALSGATLAGLATNLAAWGEVETARPYLEALEAKAGNDVALRTALARASLSLGRHLHGRGENNAAASFLDAVGRHAPDTPEAAEARRLRDSGGA